MCLPKNVELFAKKAVMIWMHGEKENPTDLAINWIAYSHLTTNILN